MKRIIACFLLLFFPSTQSFAWGFKGHRIVADIARNHLSEAAKQGIVALLGNDDLAAISTWADEVRSQRAESYGWHFVDIPKDSAGFSETRDCYKPDEKHPTSKDDHHNCVVDRITMFRQVLADKSASQQDKVEALKFIVHFVGDIHQPMHAVAEARGGNDIHVAEFGSAQCGKYPCNLHYEWDTGLIEHTGRSEQEYADYLEKLISSKDMQARSGGTPEEWANESLALAKQAWLSEGGSVDEKYFQANIGVVDERLALAGLRLAALLNQVFGAGAAVSSRHSARKHFRLKGCSNVGMVGGASRASLSSAAGGGCGPQFVKSDGFFLQVVKLYLMTTSSTVFTAMFLLCGYSLAGIASM